MHTLLVTSASNLPICGTHVTLESAKKQAATLSAAYPEFLFRVSWTLPIADQQRFSTTVSPVIDIESAAEIDRLASSALIHARMNVATYLRSLRLQSGVTMPALAKHLGFKSHPHIHDLEYGRRLWTLDMARQAEKYLLTQYPQ